jgi:hypothetical protein
MTPAVLELRSDTALLFLDDALLVTRTGVTRAFHFHGRGWSKDNRGLCFVSSRPAPDARDLRPPRLRGRANSQGYEHGPLPATTPGEWSDIAARVVRRTGG